MSRRAASSLTLALAVLVGAVGTAQAFPSKRVATQARVAISPLEADVLKEINDFRVAHHLRPLRVSGRLAVAARHHSSEMAARGYFSHTSANGSSFDRRIARFYPLHGARYWSVGENLLWSSPSVDAPGALQMWLNSPPHRDILMTARWREVGLSAIHVGSAPGAYGGREVTIVTADFGVRR